MESGVPEDPKESFASRVDGVEPVRLPLARFGPGCTTTEVEIGVRPRAGPGRLAILGARCAEASKGTARNSVAINPAWNLSFKNASLPLNWTLHSACRLHAVYPRRSCDSSIVGRTWLGAGARIHFHHCFSLWTGCAIKVRPKDTHGWHIGTRLNRRPNQLRRSLLAAKLSRKRSMLPVTARGARHGWSRGVAS